MAKIYFAGNGLESVEAVDATGLTESATFVIANYLPGAIRLGGTTGSFRTRLLDPANNTPTPVSAGSLWAHFLYAEASFNQSSGGVAAGRNIGLFKSDGTQLVRLRKTANNNTFIFEYWNGAAYVAAAAPFATVDLIGGTRVQIDIRIDFSATVGLVRCYIDKVLKFEVTGLNTSGWNIAYADFFSPSTQPTSGVETAFQGIIFADEGTLDYALKRRPLPTGQGDDVAWTGTNADIDEYPSADADFITSAVTGQKESVTGGAFPALPAATEIKAVVIGARLRNDAGSSPQNAVSYVTVGGVDYDATGNMRIATNFNGSINIFPKNPATAANWAALPASTDQYGVKSVA